MPRCERCKALDLQTLYPGITYKADRTPTLSSPKEKLRTHEMPGFSMSGDWDEVEKLLRTGCDICCQMGMSAETMTTTIRGASYGPGLTITYSTTDITHDPVGLFPVGIPSVHEEEDVGTLFMEAPKLMLSTISILFTSKHYALLGNASHMPRLISAIIVPRLIDERLDQARSWLQQCIRMHNCNQGSGTHSGERSLQERPFLPPRLIPITGSVEAPALQLVDTKGYGEAVEYCALSYCWGGFPKESTTIANLQQRHRIISVHELPATLQDAVEITQRLGVEYLWIDSICIIQTRSTDAVDTEDWKEHIPLMGTLYEQAHCTIIAAESIGAGKGILIGCHGLRTDNYHPAYGQSALALLRIPLSAKDPLGSSQTYYFERAFRDDTGASPLDRRAWAFQEYLLSSRRLILGHRQLQFECGYGHAFEVRPQLRQYSELDAKRDRVPTINLLQHAVEGSDTAWGCLVHLYNIRRLTFWGDKLAAFEGIMQAYRAQTGNVETLLAGIRKSRYTFDLCWAVARHPLPAEFKDPDLPSWAWASMQLSRIMFRPLGPFMSGDPTVPLRLSTELMRSPPYEPRSLANSPAAKSSLPCELVLLGADFASPHNATRSMSSGSWKCLRVHGMMGELGTLQEDDSQWTFGNYTEVQRRRHSLWLEDEPGIRYSHGCYWLGLTIGSPQIYVKEIPDTLEDIPRYYALALQPVDPSRTDTAYRRISLLVMIESELPKNGQAKAVTLV